MLRFDNTAKSITRLLKYLKKQCTTMTVCESTGGYERLLVSRLRKTEIAVRVAHPSRVRSFARACGYEAKTDPRDAAVKRPVDTKRPGHLQQLFRHWPVHPRNCVADRGRGRRCRGIPTAPPGHHPLRVHGRRAVGSLGDNRYGGRVMLVSGTLHLTSLESVSPDEKAAAISVDIKDSAFKPAQLTVLAGKPAKFVIKNRDLTVHTFTIEGLGIDVKVLPGSEELIELSPRPAGAYVYSCTFGVGFSLPLHKPEVESDPSISSDSGTLVVSEP